MYGLSQAFVGQAPIGNGQPELLLLLSVVHVHLHGRQGAHHDDVWAQVRFLDVQIIQKEQRGQSFETVRFGLQKGCAFFLNFHEIEAG